MKLAIPDKVIRENGRQMARSSNHVILLKLPRLLESEVRIFAMEDSKRRPLKI